MQKLLCGASVLTLLACGGAAQEPAPVTPNAVDRPASPPPAAAADPFAMPSAHEADRIPEEPSAPPDLAEWKALKEPKGLPARPKTCKLGKPAKAPACADEPSALAALKDALNKPETERDGALAALEACSLPAGFVTAVRAELQPVACADAITDPLLDKGAPGAKPAMVHLLVGQSLGAKMARSAIGQPTLPVNAKKAQVLEFLSKKLGPWSMTQATLVQQIAGVGAKLSGIGQAVLAAEAGRADLRFVEMARQVPVAEFAADAELKQIYESSLEQALEPRKKRGRDATLVALRAFADFGVMRESLRMQSARDLLGSMYGGRRVDALDALMIPHGSQLLSLHPLPPYLRVVVPGLAASLAEEIDRGAAAGLPPELRKNAPTDKEARVGRARVSLRLAAMHMRRASADAALDLLAGLPREGEVELLVALALALHEGPKDVVTMMAASSPSALGFHKLDALDAVAKKDGPWAGMALYDATLLREIAPPDGATGEYFADLAVRYTEASRKLGALPEAKLASERAEHARAIARGTPADAPSGAPLDRRN